MPRAFLAFVRYFLTAIGLIRGEIYFISKPQLRFGATFLPACFMGTSQSDSASVRRVQRLDSIQEGDSNTTFQKFLLFSPDVVLSNLSCQSNIHD